MKSHVCELVVSSATSNTVTSPACHPLLTFFLYFALIQFLILISHATWLAFYGQCVGPKDTRVDRTRLVCLCILLVLSGGSIIHLASASDFLISCCVICISSLFELNQLAGFPAIFDVNAVFWIDHLEFVLTGDQYSTSKLATWHLDVCYGNFRIFSRLYNPCLYTAYMYSIALKEFPSPKAQLWRASKALVPLMGDNHSQVWLSAVELPCFTSETALLTPRNTNTNLWVKNIDHKVKSSFVRNQISSDPPKLTFLLTNSSAYKYTG